MSSTARSAAGTPPLLDVSTESVMSAAELGVAAVRIPALLQCAGGRLIAFAEARLSGAGDSGDIAVAARVREEDGRWGAVRSIAHAPGRTMGNPVPLEASDGSIVLLTTSNDGAVTEQEILADGANAEHGRRVHLTRLKCTGAHLEITEQITDITDQVKLPRWRWYATGPGHGVRLASGRMVAVANHSHPAADGRSVYGAHGLISEDDGRSWRIGWLTDAVGCASGLNESSVALAPALEDGTESVFVTSRNEASAPECTRTLARIPVPGTSERSVPRSTGVRALEGFHGPRIQCGLAPAPHDSCVEALLTGPLRSEARQDLALHAITADASQAMGLLRPGPAGYSDITVGDEWVHVLVETGDQRPHERIELLSFTIREANDAARSSKEQKV